MSASMDIENNRLENEKLAAGFMESQAIDSLTLPNMFMEEIPDEEHLFTWGGQEVRM